RRSTSRRRARRRRAARDRATSRPAAAPTRWAAPRCASRTRSASRREWRSCALLGPDGFHDRADALAQDAGVDVDRAVREQRVVDALLEEVTIRAGIRE